MVGAVGAAPGIRYQTTQHKSARTMDLSFRDSLMTVRTGVDRWEPGVSSPGAGAPTLQWLYENHVKGSSSVTVPLSEEQLQSLAEMFDPSQITPLSLNQFVDALVETGTFSRQELNSVLYGEVKIFGAHDSPETYLTYRGNASGLTGEEMEMRKWANENEFILSSNSPNTPDGPSTFYIGRASTLMKLMPILEQLSALRG